jgi:metal-responsive CopG/Arc/MetJ family transcriptional regulator
VREAKKRVECKLEEDLVNRLDQTAALLKVNRTEIIRTACLTYLNPNEDETEKGAEAEDNEMNI